MPEQPKLTAEQKAWYLEHHGVGCPFCQDEDIEGIVGVDVDAGTATQHIRCLKCDREWWDVYTLTDVADPEP